MSIIELNSKSCQNCYKCIRECPIKAIEFKDGKAKIIEEECILCGKCVIQCPQNAKYIKNDTDKVLDFLAKGKRVYFSLAPSYKAWYGEDSFKKLSHAIKSLGAEGVEETAIGAHETSKQYMQLLSQGNMKNILVTACASFVLLVEKKYPSLIPYLAPVSSPMMAHARLMRAAYGEDIKVIFVGPCFSKKQEVNDPMAGSLVAAAITFEHFDSLLKSKKIVLDKEDNNAVGVASLDSRLYPKPTGILATIKSGSYKKYIPMACDGLNSCIEMLENLESGEVEGVFLEANVCPGACVGGPNFRNANKNVLKGLVAINNKKTDRDANIPKSCEMDVMHPRVFKSGKVKRQKPAEEQIREILLKTGKRTKSDELNCGSCGYSTCREKAEAVYFGKADIEMCLPFFRARAESMSHTVIQSSPNGIMTFDSEGMVIDLNPRACDIFEVKKEEIVGKPIPEFYLDEGFEISKNGEPYFCIMQLEDKGKVLEKTITYIDEHKVYIAFVKDITATEKHKEELKAMQSKTYETAQRVIDKQMRVVQEIASLLGETTAETKIALKALVSREE